MSAKDEILKRLQFSQKPLACHELNIVGYNENNLATRLSELCADGFVKGEIRPGKHFKEWSIVRRERNGQGLLI